MTEPWPEIEDDRPEPDPLKADRYFPEEWTPEDEEPEK